MTVHVVCTDLATRARSEATIAASGADVLEALRSAAWLRAENALLRSILRRVATGAALWLHDGPGTQRVVSGAGATHLYDFELPDAEADLFDATTTEEPT